MAFGVSCQPIRIDNSSSNPAVLRDVIELTRQTNVKQRTLQLNNMFDERQKRGLSHSSWECRGDIFWVAINAEKVLLFLSIGSSSAHHYLYHDSDGSKQAQEYSSVARRSRNRCSVLDVNSLSRIIRLTEMLARDANGYRGPCSYKAASINVALSTKRDVPTEGAP